MQRLKLAILCSTALLAVGCAKTTSHVDVVTPKNVYTTPVAVDLIHHFFYFEFDKVLLPNNIESQLAPHAKHLISNPDRRVFIDGLADEQGDYHYNYLLGLKRANAIAQILLKLGVDQSQLIVHSTGIERPLNVNSNERNRRVTLSY